MAKRGGVATTSSTNMVGPTPTPTFALAPTMGPTPPHPLALVRRGNHCTGAPKIPIANTSCAVGPNHHCYCPPLWGNWGVLVANTPHGLGHQPNANTIVRRHKCLESS